MMWNYSGDCYRSGLGIPMNAPRGDARMLRLDDDRDIFAPCGSFDNVEYVVPDPLLKLKAPRHCVNDSWDFR